MRSGRTIAFVILTLLGGGVISQLPSALADDSDNPFSALWDVIFDLQSRDNDLQAQIDELRAERNALLTQTEAEPVFVSDLYAEIEIETTEDGRTLVHVTAGNSGPDRAAGVKLTTFYLMPLFEINSIDGDLCEDKSRGIIECALGTLEADQESVITIVATARESGEANTWTVDISTTTDDADYTNNHVDYNFETGSGEPIEIPEVEQLVEERESDHAVEETETDLELEQDDSGSNSTGTETEELQESGGNQTSTEETPSGNQTSTGPEETVDNPGSNSTSTEGFEDSDDESSTKESSSEENADDAAEQEGQDDSSSETGEEQSGSDDGQVEEQEQSGESGTEGSESSDSGESSEHESSDSGSEESSDNGESSEGSSENGSEESPSQ